MEVMNETVKMSTKDTFLSNFNLLDFSFDEDFSKDIRSAAKNTIEGLEFPTSKVEYWKYTRINKIIKRDYSISAPENEVEIDLSVPSKNCIVLINGFYSEELSFFESEVGVTFSSLSEAKKNSSVLKEKFNSLVKKDEIFAQINSAYHQDGAFMHVEKKCTS